MSYFQEDTLAPALPYICYNILIGGNQEYESFSFSHSEHVAMNNVEMSPNTISLPTNGPLKYSEKIVEFPQQQYPAVKVEYTRRRQDGLHGSCGRGHEVVEAQWLLLPHHS